MIHNITTDVQNLHGLLSCEREPILMVDSGDEIHARTRCSGWGLEPPDTFGILPKTIKRNERKDPEHDIGICLVGPIGIEGAKPGMTLEVEILDLQVGAYGLTVFGGNQQERYSRLNLDDTFSWMMWQFDAQRGLAYSHIGYTVNQRPFLGCMGLASDVPGYHSNLVANQYGGNIDCKELVVGSKLLLPVAVPGALFSFGDGHAAQGDGESCDSAIECPMESVKLKLTLLKDRHIQWPVANTPAGWITFGFQEDLNEALYIALNNMLDLIVEKLNVTRKEATMLASIVVDLRVAQFVNPVVGVYAIWPHGSSTLDPAK